MKVLLLVQSEICYHPRLLKAGDFFYANKCEVYLFNTIIGLSTKNVYQSIISKRDWKIYQSDISKANIISKFRWLFASLFFKFNNFIAKTTGKYISFKHGLTKSFLFFPTSLKNQHFDFIYINLVDALPFATVLARKTGAYLVYDCQEYFKGQYSTLNSLQYNWVQKAESNFTKDCSIILATTNVMKNKLIKEFIFNSNFYRVRNAPMRNKFIYLKEGHPVLKLVWHGLNIIPENIRGVHILLSAVSVCKTSVHLYLQGNISTSNYNLLQEKLAKLNIVNKVTILPPANPDAIVESLIGYDVGLAGELAAEENQQLTSSNKLFEYIAAGMAVIMPNLPGLAETVNEYKNGILYQQGNVEDLAGAIDHLNNNRNLLINFKNSSCEASKHELFWEYDMRPVFDKMSMFINSKT